MHDGKPSGAENAGREPVRVHEPVLLAEALEVLELAPGMTVVDGTVGAGGHAVAFAQQLGAKGRLIGLDRDAEILPHAEASLRSGEASARAEFELHHAAFAVVRAVLDRSGVSACDRCFLDLGVSSLQLDQAERGFSFMRDGPLDMRMDRQVGAAAVEWLQRVREDELARVLFEYGQERHSRRIAKAIVQARKQRPIERTGQLAELVLSALPGSARHGRIHGATRSFQAIRIALNDELGQIERGLIECIQALRPGGRIAVLSFHSLEDRIVKQVFREHLDLPFKRPITAHADECRRNPRARSAKLRCGIRREVA